MVSSSSVAPTTSSIPKIHAFIHAAPSSLRRHHAVIAAGRTVHASEHAFLRSVASLVSEFYALVHAASPTVPRHKKSVIVVRSAAHATWVSPQYSTLGMLIVPAPSSEALAAR